jgi:hypothetical protein
MDVSAWLRELGLTEYEPVFRDNNVDGQLLPKLTATDLSDLGIFSVGHRRKLLDAIAVLRREAGSSIIARKRFLDAVGEACSPSDAERRQLTVMFCDLVG